MMAFVVIFTTMSFTVDMHYCGDVLVDVAIFKEAKDCGMEMAMEAISTSPEVKRKSCCQDKQVFIEGQDELKHSFEQLTIESAVFVAVFYKAKELLLLGREGHTKSSDGYPPPEIITDLTILHERFLI